MLITHLALPLIRTNVRTNVRNVSFIRFELIASGSSNGDYPLSVSLIYNLNFVRGKTCLVRKASCFPHKLVSRAFWSLVSRLIFGTPDRDPAHGRVPPFPQTQRSGIDDPAKFWQKIVSFNLLTDTEWHHVRGQIDRQLVICVELEE